MASDTVTPPERRLRLKLDLGADDLDELCGALRSIANELEIEDRETVTDRTSGGYGSGYHLTLSCDETMTGERFREELEAWRVARVAARRERESTDV